MYLKTYTYEHQHLPEIYVRTLTNTSSHVYRCGVCVCAHVCVSVCLSVCECVCTCVWVYVCCSCLGVFCCVLMFPFSSSLFSRKEKNAFLSWKNPHTPAGCRRGVVLFEGQNKSIIYIYIYT